MPNISNGGDKKRRSSLFIPILLMIIVIVVSMYKRSKTSQESDTTSTIIAVEIDKWKGGVPAAYALIHDDLGLDDAQGITDLADTIAYNRGVKIGAAGVGKYLEEKGETIWPKVRRMVAHGHEIIGHSWNHEPCVDIGWKPEKWDVEKDVKGVKALIEKNVPGAEVSFFIYPFDAYNDQRINEVKEAGYLGSRAGKEKYKDRMVNRTEGSFDPFRCTFDAYMSKEEQDGIFELPKEEQYQTSIYEDDSGSVAIQHLEAGIKLKEFALQELHNVWDTVNGWGCIKTDDYRELIDSVASKAKQGLIYHDTPTAICKYIVTRNGAKPSIDGSAVSFAKDMQEKYATDVSMVVTLQNSVENISCTQDGKEITLTKLADAQYRLYANPINGALKFVVE